MHRIVGIDFSHMHMGDLLRLVCQHPDAEVVGVWDSDPDRPQEVLQRLELSPELIFSDWETCLDAANPTVAILCAPPADHARWAERLAARGVHLLIEKPFATSTEEADTMIHAYQKAAKQLAINWPLAWYPVHRTTKRLIDEGVVGEIINIHYYDGNRGPLYHAMDKVELNPDSIQEQKQNSWFYKRSAGGGSLLDYLGYGATLASWFNEGQLPHEVTAVVDQPQGLEVDEHSVTVARYDSGLYKFETRWGTFTDPWTHQPAPKCGFVVCGSEGTISSYDFEAAVRVQTRDQPEGYEVPADALVSPHTDPVSYLLHCIDNDQEVAGPLSPRISRIGQQITDAAYQSAAEKQTIGIDSATRQ